MEECLLHGELDGALTIALEALHYLQVQLLYLYDALSVLAFKYRQIHEHERRM